MAHYLEISERITMQSRFQTLQNTSEAEKLGICLQKPHASQYSSLAARIRSYSHWTKTNPRPVDLADAGFYFTGTEDIVQCYYCALKLKRWDVFDDPWVEHARHGKHCPHVINVKGQGFYKQLNEVEDDGPASHRNLYTDDLIFTTAGQALIRMGCYKERDILEAIRHFVNKNETVEFAAHDIAKILQNKGHFG